MLKGNFQKIRWEQAYRTRLITHLQSGQPHNYDLHSHRSSWSPLCHSQLQLCPGQIPAKEESSTVSRMGRPNSLKRGTSDWGGQRPESQGWCLMTQHRGLGEGTRSGMSFNTISYISPLDGLPEHIHHIFPFTVSSFEAFGPLNECSLKERKANSLEH